MITMTRFRHTQSGAALVVALILLVALSLMAISSMNTASLDLIMAGNEQYRSRSFTAAEAGIEAAWGNDAIFDTSTDYTGTSTTTGIGDTYLFSVTRPNNGIVEAAPSRNSEGTFGAVYFRIASTGRSARGTEAVNTQELFEVVKTGGDIAYNGTVCITTTSLDSPC